MTFLSSAQADIIPPSLKLARRIYTVRVYLTRVRIFARFRFFLHRSPPVIGKKPQPILVIHLAMARNI